MRVNITAAIIIQALLLVAKGELVLPAYPPQTWSLHVTICFSEDTICSFLEKRPDESACVFPDSLLLSIDGDGLIHGPTSHPVLTRKLPESGINIPRSTVVSIVPEIDQLNIYSNAFQAIQSFAFLQNNVRTNAGVSGIDVAVDIEINGRSIAIKYAGLQGADGVPESVAELFALLRRHLPPAYERLFDYLRVPKLSALSGDLATHFRRCKVHDEWMQVDDIPIVYGFPGNNKAYSEARKKLFPNACTSSCGGCVMSEESPQYEKSLFCESCRKARAQWLKENGEKP